MKAVLADHNTEGHVAALLRHWTSPAWSELWAGLGVRVLTFADLGLNPRTPDDVLWRLCQAEGYVLVTANRNNDGPDSLEAVIRVEGTADSLPVFTIATADRVLSDKTYRDRDKLLDYLYVIDRVRGTGRLFLP